MNQQRLNELKQFIQVGDQIKNMHDGLPMWTIDGICLTWGDLRGLVAAADEWISTELDPAAVQLERAAWSSKETS